jgi:hypothetical protein
MLTGESAQCVADLLPRSPSDPRCNNPAASNPVEFDLAVSQNTQSFQRILR